MALDEHKVQKYTQTPYQLFIPAANRHTLDRFSSEQGFLKRGQTNTGNTRLEQGMPLQHDGGHRAMGAQYTSGWFCCCCHFNLNAQKRKKKNSS